MSLAENVKRLRRDKDWTQAQLAEAAELRIAHISEIEKGKGDPKLSTLYKLMRALQCSPDSLLMDADQVTTDALLKQAIERALALDEEHKRIVIHNLDMYCIAAGMVRNADTSRSLLRIYLGPHQPVMKPTPDPRP